MPRSLIVQTSFLGDVVLTTPLIAALAARGDVDVVTTPAGAALLAHHPGVRTVHPYDKRGKDAGISGLRALARTVGAASPSDVVYLAQGSWRSAALGLAAGYRERVGFDRSDGRRLYTRQVRYESSQHHAERLWRLAAGELAPPPAPDALRPRLYPGADDEQRVDQLLAAHGHAGEALVALAPGSIWGTKRWPYFPDLARQLSAFGRVVVLGAVDDTLLAAEIVAASSGNAIDATGCLSLLASAALLARTRLLVTNDSAPQHLASAMNTPTVTLFGPTVPAFGFGPLAERSRVAQVEGLACRPCDAHGPRTCPLGHWRCMRDLAVSEVLAALAPLNQDAG
ncbi:MAG: glycosyltransferase family 9 protein, partial [Gemmatimonadaceae bacterium]